MHNVVSYLLFALLVISYTNFVWFLNFEKTIFLFLFFFIGSAFWQVDAERAYHRHALVILEKLYAEVSYLGANTSFKSEKLIPIFMSILHVGFLHNILIIFITSIGCSWS